MRRENKTADLRCVFADSSYTPSGEAATVREVDVDFVGSKQMQEIRGALRGKAPRASRFLFCLWLEKHYSFYCRTILEKRDTSCAAALSSHKGEFFRAETSPGE